MKIFTAEFVLLMLLGLQFTLLGYVIGSEKSPLWAILLQALLTAINLALYMHATERREH